MEGLGTREVLAFYESLNRGRTNTTMKIKYNSPVILTYTIISIAVLILSFSNPAAWLFTSPAGLSLLDPLFYFRLFSYTVGHAGWGHLMGNLIIILLIGPLIEEKYGSAGLLQMFIITAVTTAFLNAAIFSNSLVGGSGLAFMLILLGSFSNIKSKEIPLTFVIIAFLFIGNEVLRSLKVDSISQFSHLAGSFTGAFYGFLRTGRR
jgi:membrane associated rhomboid family serine protease